MRTCQKHLVGPADCNEPATKVVELQYTLVHITHQMHCASVSGDDLVVNVNLSGTRCNCEQQTKDEQKSRFVWLCDSHYHDPALRKRWADLSLSVAF